MICKTPVTFLVYNRPEKTIRSFEAIRSARPKQLFIVADGPKDEKDRLQVNQTREILNNIDWDCEVTRIYSEINMGCALRVSSGINEVFCKVDQSIIIEDDIVASDSFFEFQEQMLDRYKDDERVMMVTGWNSFVEYSIEGYDGFFSQTSAIWGWGTWKRAWAHYRFDPLENGVIDKINIEKQLNNYMDDPFWVSYHLQCMEARIWEKLNTWDYQWALAMYIQQGFCITPLSSQCLNIGFDEQATNTKSTHPTTFMPVKLQEVLILPNLRICELTTPDTLWYDRASLILYLLMMQSDLRVLYLYHKHPNLLPIGSERKGWELYLGVFRYPNTCLEILDLLEKYIDKSKLAPIREIFNRI
jgi:hypothetical protein